MSWLDLQVTVNEAQRVMRGILDAGKKRQVQKEEQRKKELLELRKAANGMLGANGKLRDVIDKIQGGDAVSGSSGSGSGSSASAGGGSGGAGEDNGNARYVKPLPDPKRKPGAQRGGYLPVFGGLSLSDTPPTAYGWTYRVWSGDGLQYVDFPIPLEYPPEIIAETSFQGYTSCTYPTGENICEQVFIDGLCNWVSGNDEYVLPSRTYPSNAGTSTSTWVQRSVNADIVTSEQFLTFPIDNKSFIFVVQVDSVSWGSIAEGTRQSEVTRTFEPYTPFLGLGDVRVSQSQTIELSRSLYGGQHTVYSKSFVITGSSVRSVDTPSLLKQYITDLTDLPSLAASIAFGSDDPCVETDRGDYFESNYISNSDEWTNDIRLMPFTYWGIRESYAPYTYYMATPSAFTLFNKSADAWRGIVSGYNAGTIAYEDYPYSEEYALSNVASDISDNNWRKAGRQSIDSGVLTYYADRYNRGTDSISQDSKARYETILNVAGGLNSVTQQLIMAWAVSKQRSAYCRSELFQLGFSPSDLTP